MKCLHKHFENQYRNCAPICCLKTECSGGFSMDSMGSAEPINFLEMGSRTHQFLAKFNINTKKIAFLKSKGGNLYLTKECRTHQLEIPKPPL